MAEVKPLIDRPSPSGRNDWLFVTPKDSKGWILDAICREIGSRQAGSWEVVYNPKILPEAGVYFFSHYWNYLDHLKRNPHIRRGKSLVWYTHPREIPYSIEEQVEGYNQATRVLFTCSEYRELWIGRGVRPEVATVVLGGADQTLFKGHARGSGCVGLSSSFYERKNPDALFDIVRTVPHRRFRLIGRNWDQYARFDALMALPNFEYVQTDYAGYPAEYATFDVFLSLAMLEGGPIPVLEAMTENIVPVASRTGFCPDLIRHGENGYLFDVGAPSQVIAPLIEAAFAHAGDIRATVTPFTWDRFARNVHGLAEGREPDFTVAPSGRAPIVLEEPPAIPASVSPTAAAPVRMPTIARSARSPHAADASAAATLRRIDGVRAFAAKIGKDGGDPQALLFRALGRKPGAGRPVALLAAASGPLDLSALPATAQIADLAGVEPFLIVQAPDAQTVRALAGWAAATGRDGLFEIVQDDERAVADGVAAPVVVVRPGPALTTQELESLARELEGGGAGGGPREIGPHGLDGRPILTVWPGRSEVVPAPDYGAVQAELQGSVLDIKAAAFAPVVLLYGAGSAQKVVVRRAPRRLAQSLRLDAPTALVRSTAQVLKPAGAGAARVRPTRAAVAPDALTPAMLTAFLNRGGAGNPVVRALADAVGCELRYADPEAVQVPGAAVVWGVLRGSDLVVEAARRDGRPFFYIDHAYIGRGHYLNYRITRNAYEAGAVRQCPDDRAAALGVELAPWRTGGGNIIVCPPTRYFMEAHGCPNWLEDTLAALRRATDRPVEIRGKPAAGEPSEPLDNVFRRAHAIVTHSSNVAVEAVIAGTPVFVSPTSAAAPVGETDLSRIELPRRPDRRAWLSHLAYSQFSFAEIADGSAWRILMDNEGRERVS